MFARVTCPACQYKLTIPEGDMTKRQVCPNCKSPFLAGKSELEPELEMKRQTAPESAYNKTMLGEMQPPIKYNCPRCNKPLESPASEAGTKKPCPACGQRLQVPAAPPPALAAAAPKYRPANQIQLPELQEAPGISGQRGGHEETLSRMRSALADTGRTPRGDPAAQSEQDHPGFR